MVNRLVQIGLVLLATAGCTDKREAPSQSAGDLMLSPELAAGQELVKANCFVCHAQGINGAPIIGNLKMWGPRVGQGEQVLVEHAFNGYNLMPAKGGNEALGKEDIRLAVRFMLSQLHDTH